MKEQHILSAFDRDMETILGLIMKMGGLVETALREATTALIERDVELAEKVRANDAAIDRLEEEVNEQAARLIALRAPTASDLRMVLSVMKIAGSLERCGDFAKNEAKRTEVLADLPPVGGTARSIQRMSSEVQALLQDALDAFVRRDVELAQQVRHRDQDVDQLYNSIFRELLTHMMEDPKTITTCMHLHFIAKNIERMGDHVSTIADQVIYMVTGEMPQDDRPKADVTAFEGAESD